MLECWPRYEEATSYKPCFVSEEASLSLHSDDDSGSGGSDNQAPEDAKRICPQAGWRLQGSVY